MRWRHLRRAARHEFNAELLGRSFELMLFARQRYHDYWTIIPLRAVPIQSQVKSHIRSRRHFQFDPKLAKMPGTRFCKLSTLPRKTLSVDSCFSVSLFLLVAFDPPHQEPHPLPPREFEMPSMPWFSRPRLRATSNDRSPRRRL